MRYACSRCARLRPPMLVLHVPAACALAVRVRARVACACCACPCCLCPVLRAPLLRVPVLRALVLVYLCSVRLDRAHFARQSRRHRGGAPARALCWSCACLRCARLRFPCSRCVYLLCVRLLCVSALCAFVRRVVCLCSAHRKRACAFDQPRAAQGPCRCKEIF
jgi:hypothetical protein